EATSPTLGIIVVDTNSNDYTQDCYGDGVTLFDLTAIFGSGNEPTQAWCDANLDYFDGIQNLHLSP
ncbi:MAG TPA: hypothetical protein PLX66_00410, partial [Bacilli bacterium]|nr:hypothetical protein [Bacilli bacterium]